MHRYENRPLKVKLQSVINPDFSPGRGNYGYNLPAEWVPVKSLREARDVCLAYIARHNLGSGNWAGGEVLAGAVPLARVSYNGRVWEHGPYPQPEITNLG